MMHFDSKTRLLVVCAHPDDEVLGCGGTIAKALDSKATVKVMFLGEGIAARFPVGDYDHEEFREATKKRNDGAQKALALLGVQDVQFRHDRYCGQFDTETQIQYTKEVEAVMQEFNPTALFTHDIHDVNTDHKMVYRAVEAACRPTSTDTPDFVYSFEIACSGRWVFDDPFHPTVFVNVEKYWSQKLKAWQCYAGESRPFPFPRSDEGLETLAKYRGMMAGLAKVEAFRLIRAIYR